MTCYHPITAFQAITPKSNGKADIHFKQPHDIAHSEIKLPCYQCFGCRLDRSITWAARCMHEAQMHDDSQFITLTYNDENLPENGGLHPPDFVKFMKRYRKSLEPKKIRFYHGAEYGDNLGRPHHHACIFGHEFADREIFQECEGILTYYSKTLEQLWGHGFATTQDLTIGNAAYCARYIMKKINASQISEEKYHAHYETTCPTTGEIKTLLPEYSTMSRKPGIGRDWYTKFNSDIFPHDNTIYKGKNIKTPRYYEDLLRSSDEIMYFEIKAKRKAKAHLHRADNTPARLLTREKVNQLKSQQFNRKLHNDS